MEFTIIIENDFFVNVRMHEDETYEVFYEKPFYASEETLRRIQKKVLNVIKTRNITNFNH